MTAREVAGEIEDLIAEMEGADLETRLDLAREVSRLQSHYARMTGREYQPEPW